MNIKQSKLPFLSISLFLFLFFHNSAFQPNVNKHKDFLFTEMSSDRPVDESENILIVGEPGSGYTLDFDGVNDYVGLAQPLSVGSISHTIEFWVKVPLVNTEGLLAGERVGALMGNYNSSPNYNLEIHSAGQIRIYWNSGQVDLFGTTDLRDNKWHHLAFVRNKSATTFTAYIDGKVESSIASVGTDLTFTVAPLLGGDLRDGSGGISFHGDMDEVRIWEIALTQTQIRDGMCKKTTSSHPEYSSLASYYRFDENTGTTLTDSKGSNNGTHSGGPVYELSGAAIGDESTYNYGGAPFSVTQTHTDGSSFMIDDFTGTPDGAHVYLINEAPNSTTNSLSGDLESSRYYGTFVVGGTSPTHSITYDYSSNTNIDGNANEAEAKLTNRADNSESTWNSYTGYFDTDDGSDIITKCNQTSNMEYCAGFDNTTLLERPGSGYALNFDGTDQYVDCGNMLPVSYTKEAWIYMTNTSLNNNIISGALSNGEHVLFAASAYSNRLSSGHNGTYNSVIDPTALTSNTWYHVAVTYDEPTETMRLFKNGVEVSSATSIAAFTGGNLVQIGRWNTGANFGGQIDEVRVWDGALSESDIRDWMCKKVTSAHPQYCNLVSYYRFDENTGTTLIDYAGSNNGTLTNGPTYALSGAVIGNESIFAYGVDNTTTINLAHANGDDMTVNVTSGTADAIQIYRIDEAPNVTTPPAGLDQISEINHWGIKTFGGVGAVYEVVYNYDGHPGITNETNLRLSSRASNAAATWTEEPTAVLDEGANTLTLGGQTGTQFIMGSTSGNPLPVELLNFNASIAHTFVKLDWQTATEENHAYFEIERSQEGREWEPIMQVAGSGNSSSLKSYTAYDERPFKGQSYYRLKLVDVDRSFEYSDIKSLVFSTVDEKDFVIFPNPANDLFNIILDASVAMDMTLKIFNADGTEVLLVERELLKGSNNIPFQINDLAPGMYYITIVRGEHRISQMLMVQ